MIYNNNSNALQIVRSTIGKKWPDTGYTLQVYTSATGYVAADHCEFEYVFDRVRVLIL